MNVRSTVFVLAASSAVFLTASSTFLPTPLQAQSTMVAPRVSYGWERVQQLPAHTAVDIRKDKSKVLCLIDSVAQDELTCSIAKAGASGAVHLSREEIKRIRLQQKGRSAAIGMLIGGGIGAGAGAGIGAAIHGSKSGYIAPSLRRAWRASALRLAGSSRRRCDT